MPTTVIRRILRPAINSLVPDLVVGALGVNLNPNATSVADGYGHGTHLAGILQQNLNGTPSTVLGVKIADDNGQALESDLLRGLEWVDVHRAAYHIRVLNLSVSTSIPSSYATSPIDACNLDRILS